MFTQRNKPNISRRLNRGGVFVRRSCKSCCVFRTQSVCYAGIKLPDFAVRERLSALLLCIELLRQRLRLAVHRKPDVHERVRALSPKRPPGPVLRIRTGDCIDARDGTAHRRAGERAAEEVEAHIQRLIPHRVPQRIALAHPIRLVSVDGGLPLTLVLGNEDVREQIDKVAAHFLAALGECVFEEVAHGALGERRLVQQRLNADLFRDDLRQPRNGAERERLIVRQSAVLRLDGRVRRRAGAHDGEGERLIAAGDGGVQQEVAHTHAGLIEKRADLAPLSALLYLLRDLAADGAVSVAELIVARVLIDLPVLEIIRHLSNVGKSLHRACHNTERRGFDRMLVRIFRPLFLRCRALAGV